MQRALPSLDYVCNQICRGAKAITLKPPNLFSDQDNIRHNNGAASIFLFN